MVIWTMLDRTLPLSLRMIEGCGIHSFRLINEAGEPTFVKFHWRPKLGLQSAIWDETVKICGADQDFQRRDMFDAIASGNFPSGNFRFNFSRLGSANFHQIPINAPKCPFDNQQQDGHMQMTQPMGRVAYEPNTLSDSSPRETPKSFHSAEVTETGEKSRIRAGSFADHYNQARQFYLSQSAYEQAHIASALVFELSKVDHPHIREAMVGHLRHIKEDLAVPLARCR